MKINHLISINMLPELVFKYIFRHDRVGPHVGHAVNIKRNILTHNISACAALL